MISGSGMAVPSPFGSSPSASTPCLFPSARQAIFFPVWRRPPLRPPRTSSHLRYAKKRSSSFEAVLKQSTTKEVEQDEHVAMDDDEEGDDDFAHELDDEMLVDEDLDFEDFEVDDTEPSFLKFGDGAAGGGVSLAGTWWDKEALAIVEDVSKSFDGDLGIYAFKTCANLVIRVRIEKLSAKNDYPSMAELEKFSYAYQARLDEAERAGTIPQNISLEVSSPGVERVVRIPEDLERFKDRTMYVKYSREMVEAGSSQEGDGIFKLVSFDVESGYCTWGLADVRINREKAGKGRRLNKKQREWRLQTSFGSLLLVRLYFDG